MDRRQSQGSGSGSASRSLFSRGTFSNRRDGDDDVDGSPKGPMGMTSLHIPADPRNAVADLVFVHGLNGGSHSTWTFRDSSGSYMWTKDFLSNDPDFSDTRIHTFGYSSNISRESILGVGDFAHSLLSAIHDCQHIPFGDKTPLVLIGHSMGGLVIKKAYILSCQRADYQSLSQRIIALVFIATPHQGADIAQIVSRLLSLTRTSARPFFQDLHPYSATLQNINADFPRFAPKVELISFYESKPMSYGFGKSLIVEKHAAVMNYDNERRVHLDADHRDIARFASAKDPSYLAIRNALAKMLAKCAGVGPGLIGDEPAASSKARRLVSDFLGVSDAPEDELLNLKELRMNGSCQWLTQRKVFLDWERELNSCLFWLVGRPGVGKTIITSSIIDRITREKQHNCCYFFFKQGDKSRDNINALLRSMAFQMSVLHPRMLEAIEENFQNPSWQDAAVDKVDYLPVWRKIFLMGILKVPVEARQVWVIDAIDECRAVEDLIPLLYAAQKSWPLSIFVTSRKELRHMGYYGETAPVFTLTIAEDDTRDDIGNFLQQRLANMMWPREWYEQRIHEIVEKSAGCFLWVSLTQRALEGVHSVAAIDQILETTPSGMDELYLTILRRMASSGHKLSLSRAILTWSLCCFRILTAKELHKAVELELGDELGDMETIIGECCGHLIYVDRFQRVQLVHLTVRELLMRTTLDSVFKIDSSLGHQNLAMICLKNVFGNTTRRPSVTSPRMSQSRRSSASVSSLNPKPPPEEPLFTSYAAEYMFQHIAKISSSKVDDDLFRVLAAFLGSQKILWWIEYVAKNFSLQTIFLAGQTIRMLLKKRVQRDPPLPIHREIRVLERWASDLMRMVPKFGLRLHRWPESIHRLIPPFCPRDSAIRKQFAASSLGLNVQGITGNDWDDCLSTIAFEVAPICVALSGLYIAFGVGDTVVIYDDNTFQERRVLEHGEIVHRLKFSWDGRFLASAGSEILRVWTTESWEVVQHIELPKRCYALHFADDDKTIFAALETNELYSWDLMDGEIKYETVNWTVDPDFDTADLAYRQPEKVIISRHLDIIAVTYRQDNLLLWHIGENRILEIYNKDMGPLLSRSGSQSFPTHNVHQSILDLAFNHAVDSSLAAISYDRGELRVVDIKTWATRASVPNIYGHNLAASPDGRTLATADGHGGIHLFDFSTLKKLYHVQLDPYAIPADSLVLTADSLRLLEVRGKQCRAWAPSVLHRNDADDDLSDTLSITTSSLAAEAHMMLEEPAVTRMWCVPSHYGIAFSGREDGSIFVHNLGSDTPVIQHLVTQPHASIISVLDYDEGLLAAGSTWLVACYRITRSTTGGPQRPWDVSESVVEVQCGSSLQQVMISGTHSRLLLSTHESDILYALGPAQSETRVVLDVSAGSRRGDATHRWARHPKDPSLIVLAEGSHVQIRSWLDFLPTVSVDLDGVHPLAIGRLTCVHGSDLFVTRAEETSLYPARNLRRVLHVWSTADFAEGKAGPPRPRASFAAEQINLQQVVGIYNQSLVFLDREYWICSVPLDQGARRGSRAFRSPPLPARASPSPSSPPSEPGSPQLPAEAAPSVTQHFFLPYDWVGLATKMDMDVNQSGEVFFVKGPEVAVVKRGLATAAASRQSSFSASQRQSQQIPLRPYPRHGDST